MLFRSGVNGCVYDAVLLVPVAEVLEPRISRGGNLGPMRGRVGSIAVSARVCTQYHSNLVVRLVLINSACTQQLLLTKAGSITPSRTRRHLLCQVLVS